MSEGSSGHVYGIFEGIFPQFLQYLWVSILEGVGGLPGKRVKIDGSGGFFGMSVVGWS